MFSKKKKAAQEDNLDTLEPMETEILGEDDFDDAKGKGPKKKLPGWVIIPVLAVILIGSYGISLLAGGSGKDNSAGTVLDVTKVTKGTVKEEYNANGTIESENTKTYYSPVTAPVKDFDLKVGQAVKKGDLLVTFDTKNLERDNQQAQLTLQSSLKSSEAAKAKNAQAIEAANAASAQAAEKANALADEVNKLAAEVDAAYALWQENLAAAGSQSEQTAERLKELQDTIAQNQQVVNESQAVIDSTDSGYAGKRAELDAALGVPEEERTEEQQQTVATLGPVFEAYDNALGTRSTAQAEIDAANAELQSLQGAQNAAVDDAGYAELQAKFDAKYAEWEAAYQAANAPSADTGMTSADFEGLDISDNLAELAALTPEELLEKGKEGMKADMDGVIASVELAQTNSASQGMALFTIASTGDARVKIEISPDDYAKLKTGTQATITVGDSTYKGTLTYVDKIAVKNEKGTPVIGAQIHIDNPDENICIGSTAKVKMTIAESDNVLVVPTEVINASSSGDFVYIIENGVVKECPVELGTASTTQVEVLSGLSEGDLVVNDMNVDLKEGMKATANEKTSE